MKNNKRNLTIIPLVTLAVAIAVPFTNLKANDMESIPVDNILLEGSLLEESLNGEEKEAFTIFNGTIKEIFNLEDKTLVRIQNGQENEIDFIITDKTVLVDEKGVISFNDLKEGDTITSYYVMPQITTMIYPAQMETTVLVKSTEDDLRSVYVDVFDENLLSSKKDLKLNVNSENPIVDITDNEYTDTLENKVLIVFYTIQTLSLPAQTSPDKIIVLNVETQLDKEEINVPEEPNNNSEEEPLDKIDYENLSEMPFFVNGNHIQAPSAYLNENGTIMVPLRPIMEALEYEIKWDPQLKQITLGVAIGLQVGVDEYTVGRMVPQQLGTAPELKDGVTFVPIDFLTTIVNVDIRVNEGVFDIHSLA